MKTKLSLLVKLRIEVDTTKKAKHNLHKYLVFGHIVKVLFHLIELPYSVYKIKQNLHNVAKYKILTWIVFGFSCGVNFDTKLHQE